MNNKHLVLSIALIFSSLTLCAYDGDSIDQQQGELFNKLRELPADTFKPIKRNWYNGTNAQTPVSQSAVIQTTPAAEASETVRSANIQPEQVVQSEKNAQESDDVERVDETTLFGGLRDQIASIEINKETLLKYGAGALIAVTIGGVTYVLYKNGSLQKFGTAVKNHPILSVAIVAPVVLFAYLKYMGQVAPVELLNS